MKNGKYVTGQVTEWYQDDKLHRDDGPAVEVFNTERWWYQHGKRHRVDGPAYERFYLLSPQPLVRLAAKVIGTYEWWQNDERHREDGPAVEKWNGQKEWWLNGVQVTEQDVIERQQNRQKELTEQVNQALCKIEIDPDSVTFDMIEQCDNFKRKSVLIDLYGLDRYWNEKVARKKS